MSRIWSETDSVIKGQLATTVGVKIPIKPPFVGNFKSVTERELSTSGTIIRSSLGGGVGITPKSSLANKKGWVKRFLSNLNVWVYYYDEREYKAPLFERQGWVFQDWFVRTDFVYSASILSFFGVGWADDFYLLSSEEDALGFALGSLDTSEIGLHYRIGKKRTASTAPHGYKCMIDRMKSHSLFELLNKGDELSVDFFGTAGNADEDPEVQNSKRIRWIEDISGYYKSIDYPKVWYRPYDILADTLITLVGGGITSEHNSDYSMRNGIHFSRTGKGSDAAGLIQNNTSAKYYRFRITCWDEEKFTEGLLDESLTPEQFKKASSTKYHDIVLGPNDYIFVNVDDNTTIQINAENILDTKFFKTGFTHPFGRIIYSGHKFMDDFKDKSSNYNNHTEIFFDKEADEIGVQFLGEVQINTIEKRILPQILFKFDKPKIGMMSKSLKDILKESLLDDDVLNKSLRSIACYLKGNNNQKIKALEINGHTSSEGDKSYNMKLSERRAIIVKRYLDEIAGVQRVDLIDKGYGGEEPISPLKSHKNRRVEFVVKHNNDVRKMGPKNKLILHEMLEPYKIHEGPNYGKVDKFSPMKLEDTQTLNINPGSLKILGEYSGEVELEIRYVEDLNWSQGTVLTEVEKGDVVEFTTVKNSQNNVIADKWDGVLAIGASKVTGKMKLTFEKEFTAKIRAQIIVVINYKWKSNDTLFKSIGNLFDSEVENKEIEITKIEIWADVGIEFIGTNSTAEFGAELEVMLCLLNLSFSEGNVALFGLKLNGKGGFFTELKTRLGTLLKFQNDDGKYAGDVFEEIPTIIEENITYEDMKNMVREYQKTVEWKNFENSCSREFG